VMSIIYASWTYSSLKIDSDKYNIVTSSRRYTYGKTVILWRNFT